jgi:hypothetical protein
VQARGCLLGDRVEKLDLAIARLQSLEEVTVGDRSAATRQTASAVAISSVLNARSTRRAKSSTTPITSS